MARAHHQPLFSSMHSNGARPLSAAPSGSRSKLLHLNSTFHSRRISVRFSHSSSSSPFTDRDSVERFQRESWLSGEGCGDEIALQLPDLRKLLEALRSRKRVTGGGSAGAPGRVSLVGTGPGDPELLTLKAVREIERADLVLYDRLVSDDVLGLVGPASRLLYVGKAAGYHSRTQEEIHELLLNFAEAGANVVRLKGGDPLVFGRGGEEMDFLRRQGIHVKVIPGITSASGIAAELGIPLTHRGVANFLDLRHLSDTQKKKKKKKTKTKVEGVAA